MDMGNQKHFIATTTTAAAVPSSSSSSSAAAAATTTTTTGTVPWSLETKQKKSKRNCRFLLFSRKKGFLA